MSQLLLDGARREALCRGFQAAFGAAPERFFSAPGRAELGGNHTDHQGGHVLAAAIDLDTVAAVRATGTGVIRVLSQGYPMCRVELSRREPVPGEENTPAALIRGVAVGFLAMGCPVSGFDAYVTSQVLSGFGLSSSADFEVLMSTILNGLFCGGQRTPMDLAMAGHTAENRYFGKPSGLMDQLTSATGGLLSIDLGNPAKPHIKRLRVDFSACGYALCIVNSGAGLGDLTREYDAIPREMWEISGYFEKSVLSEVAPSEFYAVLPTLRKKFGDRAVLRAVHFFREDSRVQKQADALEAGDFETFLRLVRLSGDSSYMYLQNVIPAGAVEHQSVAVTLALCEHYLAGRGACRVHSGGFTGTVQAYVPKNRLEAFQSGMEDALGKGACQVVTPREQGCTELFASVQ